MWFVNGSQQWHLVFIAGLQPTFHRQEDGNECKGPGVWSAKGTETPQIPNMAITGCGTVNRPQPNAAQKNLSYK